MKRILLAALLLVPLPVFAGTTITVSVGTISEDLDAQRR